MKKFLAILTAAIMVLVLLPASLFAADTVVIANADVTYMVIIPSCVNFGTITRNDGIKTEPFNVSAEGLVDSASTIKVATTPSGIMKDLYGIATLPFTLQQPSGIFNFTATALADGEETIESDVECNSANLTAAGSYKGVMTFTITYETNKVEENATSGSTIVDYLCGWPNFKTHSTRGDSVSAQIGFKDWTINELTSLQFSILKNGNTLATCTLINPSGFTGKQITCSFYKDASLTATGSWVLQPVSIWPTGGQGVFDTIEVRAVKGGTLYVFTSTDLRYGIE